MTVRVRFAPSPTGYLHIGGARTALFNYLFARHEGGIFILRIEDTDIERSKDEFTTSIIEGMKWLGMEWDEGPYFQSERMDIYRRYIDKLLKEGKAYKCYCTQEELENWRKEALEKGLDAKYNRRCRNLTHELDKPYTVRIKAPLEGQTVYHDLCRGTIVIDNKELDDLIIARSDGTPTYNFTVVIDDVEMGITHVIRGDDHINNTPRQITIYNALGYELPKFAHLPMIYGPDKKKLSKRHGAVGVLEYKEMGFLPEAMINYLARLGWAYGDQEIFTKEELIRLFDINHVSSSPAIFDPEKLKWVNSQHMMMTENERLAKLVTPFLKDMAITPNDQNYLLRVIELEKPRANTLKEMAEKSLFFFTDDIEIDDGAASKWLNEKSVAILKEVDREIEGLSVFNQDGLSRVFDSITKKMGLKMKEVAQPVRVAITGGTASPGIFEIMELIGKEKVLKRIRGAISRRKDAGQSTTT